MAQTDTEDLVRDALGIAPKAAPSKPRASVEDLVRQVFADTEPGVGDYLEAGAKSVAAGAVEGVGAGIEGVGLYTGADSLIDAGRAVSSIAPTVDPRLAGTLPMQVARGLGSSGPLLAAGAGAAVATGGNPYAVAGTVGAGSVAMEAGSTYEDALTQPGATDPEARASGRIGGLAGILDVFPEASASLRAVRGASRGVRVMEEAAKPLGGLEKLLRLPDKLGRVGAVGASAVGEGIQETVQGVWEQYAQQLGGAIKTPEDARSVWDISQSDGIPGGLAGSLMEAAVQAIGHFRARGHAQQTQQPSKSDATLPSEVVGSPVESAGTSAQASSADSISSAAIELPDEDLAGARDRFHAAVKEKLAPKGKKSLPFEEPQTPTLFEAPAHIQERASTLGAKVALFDGGEGYPAEGWYDRPSKTLLVNARATPEEQNDGLATHEIVHFIEDERPDVYKQIEAAIDAGSPTLREFQENSRRARQPGISDESARSEAVAEVIQGLANMHRLVRENREMAVKIATYHPGIIRSMFDALVDFAHKIGLAKSKSIGSMISDLDSQLSGTEAQLGAQKAVQVALKYAELEATIRREADAVEQPKASRMRRAEELELPVPDDQAEPFPTPLFDDEAAAKEAMRKAAESIRSKSAESAKRAEEERAAETFRAQVRRAADARLADLDAKIARLPPGKLRTRTDAEAIELRSALEDIDRQARRDAPKEVGDVVLLPSGERGRVVKVEGQNLRVLMDRATARASDPDTTLGLPEKRVRTVTASEVEAIQTSEPAGPRAPTKTEAKAAIKSEPKASLPVEKPAKKAGPEFLLPTAPEPRGNRGGSVPRDRVVAASLPTDAPAHPVATPNATPEAAAKPKSAPREAQNAVLPTELQGVAQPRAQPPARKPEPVYHDERITVPGTHDALRSMVAEAGWQQVGGQAIMSEPDPGQGGKRKFLWRTKWIPHAEWWPGRPGGFNPEEVANAVEKAIAGKKLGVAQQALVTYMLDQVEQHGLGGSTGTIQFNPFLGDDFAEREAIQGEDQFENEPVDDAPFAIPFGDKPAEMPKGRIIGHDINGEPIYEKVERGDFKRALPTQKKPTQVDLFEGDGSLFEKDIEKRDKGGLFALRTDTPEFRKWFGESKVVDEDGQPLVVYHGTDSIFTAFDPSKLGHSTGAKSARDGFWFTDSGDVASGYANYAADTAPVKRLLDRAEAAERRGDWDSYERLISEAEAVEAKLTGGGQSAMAVYLSLRNPAEMDAGGAPFVGIDAEIHAFIRTAKREGRDGVIIRNLDDHPNHNDRPADHFLAFRPEQIKSATGNRGTFDASNPDIRFALGDKISPRKPIPKDVLAGIVGRMGQENEDQTARTSAGEQVRAFHAAVRGERLEGLDPATHAEAKRRANRALREDSSGLKEKLLDKLTSGKVLEPWEQLAFSKIADRAAQTMFGRATLEAVEDATRLRVLLENYRRKQAQGMGIIRDPYGGRHTGPEAFAEIVTMATSRNRAKIQAILDQLDNPHLSKEARFALKAQLDKQIEDEAKATKIALRKLTESGLHPDLVVLDYFHDPYVFSRASRIVATSKAGAMDYAMEFRYASMLSGPATQIRNITGNAASMAYTQVLERVAESLVNVVSRNPDAASFGELPSYFKAWVPGLAQAGHNWWQALVTELPVFEIDMLRRGAALPTAGFGERVDNTLGGLDKSRAAIPGAFGRLLRFPSTTMLMAFDEFFKTLASHTQATALAYRQANREGLKGAAHSKRMGELMMDASEPIHAQSLEATKRDVLFQGTDPFLRALLQAREAIDKFFHVPVGTVVLPFVTVPYNIFKSGLSIPTSPVWAVRNWMTGKWEKEPGLREHNIAESVLGLGVTLALLWAMRSDDDDDLPRITGSRSSKYGEALLQERTAPAQSWRNGDTWHSFASIEPLSVAGTTIFDIGEAVHAARNQGTGAQFEEAFLRMASSLAAQGSNKTWLRTVGDLYKLVTEPQSGGAARFARDTFVTPFIPNIIRAPARATDDYMRQNTVRKTDDDGVWSAAAKSLAYEVLPIAANAPPPKFDLWGEPVLRNGRSFGERLGSPTPESGAPHVSPLDLLIKRWNDRIEEGDFPDEKKFFPEPPDPFFKGEDGQTHYFTHQEKARLEEEAGKMSATALIQSKALNFEHPTPRDIERMKSAISRARATVKKKILKDRTP